jgi:hypothetical protein
MYELIALVVLMAAIGAICLPLILLALARFGFFSRSRSLLGLGPTHFLRKFSARIHSLLHQADFSLIVKKLLPAL